MEKCLLWCFYLKNRRIDGQLSLTISMYNICKNLKTEELHNTGN